MVIKKEVQILLLDRSHFVQVQDDCFKKEMVSFYLGNKNYGVLFHLASVERENYHFLLDDINSNRSAYIEKFRDNFNQFIKKGV